MIERRSEPFGAAAIALVQANGIPSCHECALREAPHVTGIAGSLQAVHENERRAFPRRRLPVALSANFRSGFRFKFARRAGWQAGKTSLPVSGRQCLRVRAAQQQMRFKVIHSGFILRYFHGPPAFMDNG